MNRTVEARIGEALSRRREQRPFVAELGDVWRGFTASFEEVAGSLTGLRNGLAAAPQTADHHVNLDKEIRRFEHTDGLTAVRRGIAAAGQVIEGVQYRVQRDSVNIGVVGMTRAGKSTLLRNITDLGEAAIPTAEFDPTTASASRIYHRVGPPSARLHLHTWESFRDLYLAPLFDEAQAGPVPNTVERFAAAPLPAGGVTADRYLRKLQVAQATLGDYVDLLGGGEREVPLAELRPYVAYPPPGSTDPHRYHAVRVAHLFTPFPNLDVADVGLVDFPGRGEAGLNIKRVFLTPMQREVDVLVMVKRPDVNSSFMTDEDWQTIELADVARFGVPLEQFLTILVNRDRGHVDDRNVDRAATSVREQAGGRGICVAVADVTDQDEVFDKLMAPVLEHLARNLAEMDRAAVRTALLEADAVRAQAERMAEDLVAATGRWRREVPNAERVFRNQVQRLYELVSYGLSSLRDRYNSQAKALQATEELEAGIAAAVADARTWVKEGLGTGSRAKWFNDNRIGAFAAGAPAARQNEIDRARAEISRFFLRIDASATESVLRLWREIVEAMRAPLTPLIVPEVQGSDGSARPLAAFRALVDERPAPILSDALEELNKLDLKYGSIVLRVARPIIRRIHWQQDIRGAAGSASRLLREAGNVAIGAAGVAAAAAGVPVVVLPAGPEQPGAGGGSGPWWAASPSTSAGPVAGAPSGSPAAQGGAPGVSETDVAARAAEAAYDEITAMVTQCVDDLDAALRKEAQVMALALAAAADQFFDAVIRRNDVLIEYEELCRPHRKELWPELFGGGEALVAAEIAAVEEGARQLKEASLRLAGLGAALRLHTPQAERGVGSRSEPSGERR